MTKPELANHFSGGPKCNLRWRAIAHATRSFLHLFRVSKVAKHMEYEYLHYKMHTSGRFRRGSTKSIFKLSPFDLSQNPRRSAPENQPKCLHEQPSAQYLDVHSQRVQHATPKSPFSVLAVGSSSPSPYCTLHILNILFGIECRWNWPAPITFTEDGPARIESFAVRYPRCSRCRSRHFAH